MSNPFSITIKPVGRQPYRTNVNNDTTLQEILSQLRDQNLLLYHNCEEIQNLDEKKLLEFPTTAEPPFYFIPEVIDYNRTPSVQCLVFHNGSKQKEVKQDGRVISACLSSFFKGPWRLICEGHLISFRDLPSVGDIYVEQKTENFINIEIYGPNLLGNIIFELPKTATISDVYQRLLIRYGIKDRYLFQNGLTVDGPIINYADDRGFVILQLLTYIGVAVNHKSHGTQRYGFLYRNSTIYDLKKLIRAQKKIPIPWIELSFDGTICKNDENVFNFVHGENDAFELVVTHGETFSININDKSYDVQWDFSIEDLRQISGIPNGKRYKTFLGFYPYDSSITVDSALFQPDQIIDACAKSNFRIFIYDTCTREKLTINVYPCETIHNLRVRISALKKIDSNSFRLIFMGTQLNDKQNFYESKISKDATINLIMTKT